MSAPVTITGATALPNTAERVSLAYKLAEQGGQTVDAQLLLRACAVAYFAACVSQGSTAAPQYLRALADEMECGR